jgi:hypothetical protein
MTEPDTIPAKNYASACRIITTLSSVEFKSIIAEKDCSVWRILI